MWNWLQLLALISTLLSPVRARQEFLLEFSIDFKQTEKLSPQSEEMWTGRICWILQRVHLSNNSPSCSIYVYNSITPRIMTAWTNLIIFLTFQRNLHRSCSGAWLKTHKESVRSVFFMTTYYNLIIYIKISIKCLWNPCLTWFKTRRTRILCCKCKRALGNPKLL